LNDEHEKRGRFLEFALALQEFISEFSSVRQHDEDIADFLLYLGRPHITESAVLPKTKTGTYVWKILSDELGFDMFSEKLDENTTERVDQKTEYFMNIPSSEYDSLDFANRVRSGMRGFRRNWLERSYSRHRVVFWIIGTAIAAAGLGLRFLMG
jgi:hypothetical protein